MMAGIRSGPVRPRPGPGRVLNVTPESAGWEYVAFSVVELAPSVSWTGLEPDRETAITPLSGSGRVVGKGIDAAVGRRSVFEGPGRIVYLPPGVPFEITTDQSLTVAVGSAPAEGRYPPRVIEPEEMRSELRGGGSSYRQVVHSLAYPLPAERLILYEVFVPRGAWSGWPPHCHDGRDGSPYLEEVYYFRLDRSEGYALHRNWRAEENFDEVVVARDGDAVLVPKGYHTSVACPGANMYFLNYLAGELIGEERRTPPHFDPEHTWIEADWEQGAWTLPVTGREQNA